MNVKLLLRSGLAAGAVLLVAGVIRAGMDRSPTGSPGEVLIPGGFVALQTDDELPPEQSAASADAGSRIFDAEPKDPMIAPSRVGDWRGVDQDGNLGEEIRPQWVMLTPEGTLEGSIVTGDGSDLPAAQLGLFLAQGGRVAASGRTATDGTFRLPNITSGVYSLFAAGDRGFLTFAFQVVPYLDGAEAAIGLDTAAVPAPYDVVIAELESKYPTMRDSSLDNLEYDQRVAEQRVADDRVPRGLVGLRDLLKNVEPGQAATSLKGHQVAIRSDGSLIGRLHGLEAVTGRPLVIDEARVLLVQEGAIVAETEVDDRGVFQFTNLVEGYYGLVAAGPDGFGAVAFNAVLRQIPADSASNTNHGESFVAAADEPVAFAMAIVTNPADIAATSEATAAEVGVPVGEGLAPLAPQQTTGGGAAGGSSPGGELALAAATAAILAGAAAGSESDEGAATPIRP